MDFDAFVHSVKDKQLPAGLSVCLNSLWYDAAGDWATAHSLVDSLTDSKACLVHAYLHRKEGDTWNADYWYRRANSKRPATSLEEEWRTIVQALL
ncbi:hypothetical protein I5907_01050 [Panacibacter sp. DH6]|uniref:Uncharacterized protein n=1 Tax=Panacibacter microcysteis TaxID=2793269 RepID=A0A931DZS5_9BACT|nr:hypothetical protein [Panacibacter microcysteis]MBG9374805.1 hypothetical protein [Panacibacter microcysteis]